MAEPDHKRCLGCGYILDGLPEPRCPECGRGFDPARPETYFVTAKARTGAIHLGLALLAPAILMVPWSLAGSLGGNAICGLMALSVGLSLYVVAHGFRELLKPPWRQPRRICWWLALFIAVPVVVACALMAYAFAV